MVVDASDEKPFLVADVVADVVVDVFDESGSVLVLSVFDRRPCRDMPMEIRLNIRSMSGARGSLSLLVLPMVAVWGCTGRWSFVRFKTQWVGVLSKGYLLGKRGLSSID